MTLNVLVFKIPEKLPKDMQKEVDKLKKSKSQEECLRKAWNLLKKKYRGAWWPLITRFHDLWTLDLNKIWNRKLGSKNHCTVLNYLMKVLLIRSGWFKKDDIKSIWTMIWLLSIHQYMKVRIGRKWLYVDPWGAHHNIKLGDYARGRHY